MLLLCYVTGRRHPPPNERKLKELAAAGEKLGLNIDISSAGALEASLNEIRSSCKDQNVVEVRQGDSFLVSFRLVKGCCHLCMLAQGFPWADGRCFWM